MYDPALFREYDIRGRAPELLSPMVARGVASALGTRIRARGGESVVVGRDVRHSSPALASAAAHGFAATGLRVLDLGVVPTPVVYHAISRLNAGGGMMVTGSHNPKSDNGLKVCLGPDSIHGEGIRSLRVEAMAGKFAVGAGTIASVEYIDRYFADLIPRFRFRRPFRIVVDCGNGVMGPVVLEAVRRLGITAIPLYCDPDGDFPNHIPDPEVPKYTEELRASVVANSADCGLGFDGDGDRVGVIDERGRKISADHLIAVFARDMLTREPGGLIRYDVKCGDFLDSWVRRLGGIPVMGVTGHSLLKRDIKRDDAILGGELSGHIVFNRGYLPIDDALYAALMFLHLLDGTEAPASAIFAEIPESFATAEIKLPCADAAKFDVVGALATEFARTHEVATIDGARVRTGDGWFLVRASNTTPNLTVRIEAGSRAGVHAARDILVTALRAHAAVDVSPLVGDLV